jgi:hypothetical protein
MSPKSLMATISISGFSKIIFKLGRPIRPKPLIAIFVIFLFYFLNCSYDFLKPFLIGIQPLN